MHAAFPAAKAESATKGKRLQARVTAKCKTKNIVYLSHNILIHSATLFEILQ